MSDFDKQNNMLGPERLFPRLSIKYWALVLTSLANITAKRATDVMKFQILLIRKTLEQSEMKMFDEYFPTFQVLRLTMWRWKKEVLPKAPLQQSELDVMTNFFFQTYAILFA